MIIWNYGPSIYHPVDGSCLFPTRCGMCIRAFEKLCREYGIDNIKDARFTFE
jgi:hypothetical protein